MCLIAVAWQTHPNFDLLVAANRDEFHARPTEALHRWPQANAIAAGRDLQAGGTWLGATACGRFAAVTNYRDPMLSSSGKTSRGALVHDFLASDGDPDKFAGSLALHDYAPFGLLLANEEQFVFVSSIAGEGVKVLAPGNYVLSNHLLDTPWPKAIKAQKFLQDALPDNKPEEALFFALADRELAIDSELPNTGVSHEWERRLSAVFISGAEYGTRASSVLLRSEGSLVLAERSFGADAKLLQERTLIASRQSGDWRDG